MSGDPKHPDYINEKGEVIPSVTQIIKILNHPGYAEWANYLGFKKLTFKTHLADLANIGTIVHERIDQWFHGVRQFPFTTPDEEMEIETKFNRFIAWAEEFDVKPIMTEERMQNERYGGTIDLVAQLSDGPITLIDFKTASGPKPQHMLQLGGYLNLMEEKKPDIYKKIELCQIVTLGGKKLQTVTRPKEEMDVYRNAFEKIYIMRCVWLDVLADNWSEKIIQNRHKGVIFNGNDGSRSFNEFGIGEGKPSAKLKRKRCVWEPESFSHN